MTVPSACPSAWQVLIDGPDESLVLAVDFSVTSRAEATFADLAPMLDCGRPVWQTRQPPAPLSFDDYVTWWCEDIRRDGREVAAVLGYCVGGVYAAELCRRLAGGRAATLILVEPEQPTVEGLTDDFLIAMETLSPMLPPDESAAARQALRRADRDSAGLTDFGTRLAEIFERTATAAFARIGLGDLSDELAGAFRLFVSYLAAADGVDVTVAWGQATAVSSVTPTPWAKLAARELRFDVGRADILRDRTVAQALRGLLT